MSPLPPLPSDPMEQVQGFKELYQNPYFLHLLAALANEEERATDEVFEGDTADTNTHSGPTCAENAQALKDAGFQAPGAVQPHAAPQYTQEQLDEMFKVWKPSKDIWSALRGDDEGAAIQALTTLRDGLMAQA